MAGHATYQIGIGLILTLMAGCASAQSRFYTLDAAAAPSGTPATKVTVMVGPVAVPSAVDQPQFVVQAGPNRVDVDEFNRWAAPLRDSISRVVASDLASQLGTSDVATNSLTSFAPDYRVTIDVLRFDSMRGQAISDDAVWTVIRTSNGTERSGHTAAQINVPDDSFSSLAAAHSRALAQVSADIAAAIRTTANSRVNTYSIDR
jgi:uncharacterized lipoprotein YmbA